MFLILALPSDVVGLSQEVFLFLLPVVIGSVILSDREVWVIELIHF